MRAMILGGAGMIGQKLVYELCDNAKRSGLSELILHDIVTAKAPVSTCKITSISGNISEGHELTRLAELRPDLIVHLAAIVSGEAEKLFDKGWDINAHGSWHLLEALRQEHIKSDGQYCPKFVFASSIAVFGAPFPDNIDDEFLCAPQTSYGAQKAMTELLVSEYSRKGFVDGISIRLPTICVRPGKANLAASSFFSSIIREPLNGMDAILPVSDQVRHWHASPRSAVQFLTHAGELDTSLLNDRRALNMPGVSCTVAEQIEALRIVAGNDVIKHIKPQTDQEIINIVSGWPRNFAPERALKLGFKAENSFEDIIRVYIADEMQKN